MKYREHRGGLAESLATTTEVSTMEELESALNKDTFFPVSDIKFEHVGIDERCGWDTYYVTALYGTKRVVMGMSDGKLC